MRLLNADQELHITVYDEQHDDHMTECMTVREILDTYTDEGCPTIYSNLESKCILRTEKNLIQRFHDYQVDWLKSRNDLGLESDLEELIIRFLHDTANRYMLEMEIDRTKALG